MKFVISAIISLAAVSVFANEPKKATTTHTTTTTTTAPAAAAPAATTTTMKEEKKSAHAMVDCKDTKNKDKAECKSTH